MLCSSMYIFGQTVIIEKPQVCEPLHMMLIHEGEVTQQAAQALTRLLIGTGLFEINISTGSMPTEKKDITKHIHSGYSVVLFLQQAAQGQITIRLYDATDASMLLGKTIGSNSAELTHRLVADAVYVHLFNHESYFLTKIAYVKKSPTLRNKTRTELCIFDPSNGSRQTLLKDNRILVAPQWLKTAHNNHDTCWLAISEFTPSNVRLLGVDLQGNTWSILNFDGTCVGTVQQDDSTFVYVRSGVLWLYEFDKRLKKARHTRLTDAKNTCGCPSLLSSGDIIYACNGKICRYSRTEKKSHVVPITGNCIAPDVHKTTDRIIFSRSVKGVLQLHCCDAEGKNVTQVTYGPGNKSDACWSPCGNYIVYTRCDRGKEQIALYNCLTGTENIVTPEDEQCGYPSWSEPCLQLYN